MSNSVGKALTLHDYRQLPEGPPYYQLVEGELYMAPSPDLFHQDILGNIYFMLRGYLEKHPIGTVHLSPSDVEFSELNAYQPDIYFVSKARKAILTKHGATGAPEFIAEVLSPKTAKLDKGKKRIIYARTGVEELWLVDPTARQVQVFRLQDSADTPIGIHGEKARFVSLMFPSLRIQVAKIFRR